MKLVVMLLVLAACSRTRHIKGTERPIGHCRSLDIGPHIPPDDPAGRAAWARVGLARQKLFNETLWLVELGTCESLFQAGTIFAREKILLREIDALVQSTEGHFARWADLMYPPPRWYPMISWRTQEICPIQPELTEGVNILSMYPGCIESDW